MTDFLEEKRREIDARLKELRPLVDEYHRLEAASRALAGVESNGNASGATRTRRASTGTRKASGAGTGTGTGRRGRPKGSGSRAKEALELIKSRPGITIPEMAEAMGIKQNYLYRVVPELQKDGKVTKSGKGWHLRGE